MRTHESELLEIQIDADMVDAGLNHVAVNVDATQQCYLSGEVKDGAQEAEAMAIALAHAPAAVHDGLHHPGQDVPHFPRSGNIGPYGQAGHESDDPGAKILAGADLRHRVFDAPAGSTLVTGTPID